MTTRPGAGAEGLLRRHRGQRLCNCLRVTRRDGNVIRVTDHDRQVQLPDGVYVPVRAAALSAERREAGFRSQDQEAHGRIDGLGVTIPDLMGDRYSGAEVVHTVTQWDRPWLVVATHYKWIRSIRWAGSIWTATMDGRAAEMQRPSGGRFGGSFTRSCPYKLGGPYCGVNMAVGAGFAFVGCRVQTAEANRMAALFAPLTWPGTYDDEYFRDGEIEWIWGPALVSGSATSGTTLTSLTDSTKSWATDEHVGRLVLLTTGAGGPVIDGQHYAEITGNTATVLQFAGGVGATHASGQTYEIAAYSDNRGVATPIVGYRHATRRCEFLLPTPFPIAVGDGGIYRAGCDGLSGTCKDRFNNLLRFGGDPLTPSAAEILEPPSG